MREATIIALVGSGTPDIHDGGNVQKKLCFQQQAAKPGSEICVFFPATRKPRGKIQIPHAFTKLLG